MAVFLGGVLLSLVILWAWSSGRSAVTGTPTCTSSATRRIDRVDTHARRLDRWARRSAGNTAEVLENGAFFDVLIGRIQAARESVHFGDLPVEGGTTGPPCRRCPDRSGAARSAVCGYCWTPKAPDPPATRVVRQMRDAGCRVVFFHERKIPKHRRVQRPRPPQARGHRRA